MARGIQHSDETKAAVMAALLAGQSITDVASEYSLPVGTVKTWAASNKRRDVANVEPQKRERIGQLLMEYLEANLETLKTQTVVFRDEKWLLKQSASDVAVLHGVITDKAIRLLEAFGKAEEAEADETA